MKQNNQQQDKSFGTIIRGERKNIKAPIQSQDAEMDG
jgi:hypothetical protein